MPPRSKPTMELRRASEHIPSTGQTVATQPLAHLEAMTIDPTFLTSNMNQYVHSAPFSTPVGPHDHGRMESNEESTSPGSYRSIQPTARPSTVAHLSNEGMPQGLSTSHHPFTEGSQVSQGGPFNCMFCNDELQSQKTLHAHILSFHVRPKVYRCRPCGAFSDIKDGREEFDKECFDFELCGLMDYREEHLMRKVYICDYCGKVFRGPSPFARHLTIKYSTKPSHQIPGKKTTLKLFRLIQYFGLLEPLSIASKAHGPRNGWAPIQLSDDIAIAACEQLETACNTSDWNVRSGGSERTSFVEHFENILREGHTAGPVWDDGQSADEFDSFEGALFTYACRDEEDLFRPSYVLGNGEIISSQALDDTFKKVADMSLSRAPQSSLNDGSNAMNDVEEGEDDIDDDGGDDDDMEWSEY